MDKGKFGRRDRLVKEKNHDTYREGKKKTEPSVCPQCGAVVIERFGYRLGRRRVHSGACAACGATIAGVELG